MKDEHRTLSVKDTASSKSEFPGSKSRLDQQKSALPSVKIDAQIAGIPYRLAVRPKHHSFPGFLSRYPML